MKGKIFVITDTEAGWDCVKAVSTNFQAIEDYLVERGYDKEAITHEEVEPYMIHTKYLL